MRDLRQIQGREMSHCVRGGPANSGWVDPGQAELGLSGLIRLFDSRFALRREERGPPPPALDLCLIQGRDWPQRTRGSPGYLGLAWAQGAQS